MMADEPKDDLSFDTILHWIEEEAKLLDDGLPPLCDRVGKAPALPIAEHTPHRPKQKARMGKPLLGYFASLYVFAIVPSSLVSAMSAIFGLWCAIFLGAIIADRWAHGDDEFLPAAICVIALLFIGWVVLAVTFQSMFY